MSDYYIHIGDAENVIGTFKQYSVNCVFSSPSPPITLEERIKLLNIMNKCKHCLIPSGVLWLQLGDYYFENGSMMLIPETMILLMKSSGWLVRNKLVWHRTEHYKQLDRQRFRIDYEFLYLLTQNMSYYFNDKLGIQDSSIVKAQVEQTKPGEFKSGFPEKLVEVAIRTTTLPNDTVLDPLCGTGTTGVVALKNKRNFIGIESQDENKVLLEKRLSKFI